MSYLHSAPRHLRPATLGVHMAPLFNAFQLPRGMAQGVEPVGAMSSAADIIDLIFYDVPSDGLIAQGARGIAAAAGPAVLRHLARQVTVLNATARERT